MNTLNLSKSFSQLNYLITEADLFGIYINVNFPSFNINMGISGLRPVLETTKIFRLKQMIISDFNASEAFS